MATTAVAFLAPAPTEGQNRTNLDAPGGVKFDGDKLRMDLIPAQALETLASIYTYGANKYRPHNWLKGMSWSRVFAAMMRHMWAWWRGEVVDAESGLSHLGHAAWCVFTLLEFEHRCPQLDDRLPATGLLQEAKP